MVVGQPIPNIPAMAILLSIRYNSPVRPEKLLPLNIFLSFLYIPRIEAE